MARTGIRSSAIIIRNNEVLLIHRKKEGSEYWVFPGGGVEDNETWEQALVREVKEELNLDVLHYSLAFMDFNTKDEKEHPYYFCDVSEGVPQMVGEEVERNSEENLYELQWVKLSDISSLPLVPASAKEKFLKSQKQ